MPGKPKIILSTISALPGLTMQVTGESARKGDETSV
jgi:hypothetical protein